MYNDIENKLPVALIRFNNNYWTQQLKMIQVITYKSYKTSES